MKNEWLNATHGFKPDLSGRVGKFPAAHRDEPVVAAKTVISGAKDLAHEFIHPQDRTDRIIQECLS